MYRAGDYNFGYRTGWVCPKCGRVYSPDYPWCNVCGNERTFTTTSTTIDTNIENFDEYLDELNKAKEKPMSDWWKLPYDFTCGVKNPYINKKEN